jgi:hypothetical protein
MQIAMYFQQAWNRTLLLDEQQLQTYRWNQTHGLYRGF